MAQRRAGFKLHHADDAVVHSKMALIITRAGMEAVPETDALIREAADWLIAKGEPLWGPNETAFDELTRVARDRIVAAGTRLHVLNWSGEDGDSTFGKLGWPFIIGNFDGTAEKDWPARVTRHGAQGGEVSSWGAVDEFILGHRPPLVSGIALLVGLGDFLKRVRRQPAGGVGFGQITADA
jgi:hypothetical protein